MESSTTTSPPTKTGLEKAQLELFPLFPSMRFLMAANMCLCFVAMSISTSNIAVTMVCMVKDHQLETNTTISLAQSEHVNATTPSIRKKRDVSDNTLEIQSTNSTTMYTFLKKLCAYIGVHISDDAPRSTASWKMSAHISVHGNSSNDSDLSASENDTDPTPCKKNRRKKHLKPEELMHKPETKDESVEVPNIRPCSALYRLDWSPNEQGNVFAAHNFGSLLMLAMGPAADRLNGKWTTVAALFLMIVGNLMVPLLAHTSIWLVIIGRSLIGVADALLSPSVSSMITRWFPPNERSFAIGLVTGGRQIGTLLIMSISGVLCLHTEILHGWPSVFYLSAGVTTIVLLIWLVLAADKPSKHCFISKQEMTFIDREIKHDALSNRTERGPEPWKEMLTSRAVIVAIAALVCHEYPMLIPMYMCKVLQVPIEKNGPLSALPIAVLFISKTLSCSLSSYLASHRPGLSSTTLVKAFNAIASLGLGVCFALLPLFSTVPCTLVALCLGCAFAGLHTPGVQTALVQLAPAYTGLVTGLAFFVVSVVNIGNKKLNTWLVGDGTRSEWALVFGMAATIAALPVFFFTLWGSAKRQPWARPTSATPKLSVIYGP